MISASYRAIAISAGIVAYWPIATSAIEFRSPNQKVCFQVLVDPDGHLAYTISSDSQSRIGPSQAGIIIDDADLGASIKIGTPTTRSIAEEFPWRGNKSSAKNICEVIELPMHSESADVDWFLEARLFDDGVGFRYRVPRTGKAHIAGESTTWQVPSDATLWFQTNTSNYEGVYRSSPVSRIPSPEMAREKRQPVTLGPPMTVVYKDGTFGLISEAALYDYSGLTLRPLGQAGFQAIFEDDPDGWWHEGSLVSPWRVILLSRDLNGLVNSDVIAALCNPPDPDLFPDGIQTAWIRPGKAPCTWMVFGNDGAQWDRQRWFVDRAAATGCEYLLVDAGWRSNRWGWSKDGGDVWARAAELCQYAAERNVGIVLWHAFPEGREDGPGLTSVEAREELFRNCRQAGVKGVKIDFFDSESKAVIDAYEDLLRRAAKYQLMINFHGANKPTGESRTWPNEITREGIREQEYVLWDSLPLAHYGALPFTRMVAGHADFLPGYVQPRFLKNTTAVFQMASVIVFSSPFLCWPDNPEAYLNSPLLQFVRTVPVTWDETRVLPGSVIGKTVLMARRHGDSWYVAVLNCQSESHQLDLDLSFTDLAGKQLTLYRDGVDKGACVIESGLQPPPNGKLTIELRSGGGCLIHISSPKQFSGWK